MNETEIVLANIEDQNVINEDQLISEVLVRLDNFKITTFYVVNLKFKLIGVITEGDIRRFLINRKIICITKGIMRRLSRQCVYPLQVVVAMLTIGLMKI